MVAERVITDRLGPGTRIVSITMTEAADTAGEPLLALRVVYDSNGSQLDAKRTAGLIRHIRAHLHDEIAEDRFPLLSLISRADADAEAA